MSHSTGFARGEEIVVSGMSGRFPKSHNIEEFENNLYNKVRLTKYASPRMRVKLIQVELTSQGKLSETRKRACYGEEESTLVTAFHQQEKRKLHESNTSLETSFNRLTSY